MEYYDLENWNILIAKFSSLRETDTDKAVLRHHFDEQLHQMLTELQIPDSSFFDLQKILSSRLDLMDWFVQKSIEITNEIFPDHIRYSTIAYDDADIIGHQSDTREYLQEKLFPDLEERLRELYPKHGLNPKLEEFTFEALFDYGTQWHILHYDDDYPALMVEYIPAMNLGILDSLLESATADFYDLSGDDLKIYFEQLELNSSANYLKIKIIDHLVRLFLDEYKAASVLLPFRRKRLNHLLYENLDTLHNYVDKARYHYRELLKLTKALYGNNDKVPNDTPGEAPKPEAKEEELTNLQNYSKKSIVKKSLKDNTPKEEPSIPETVNSAGINPPQNDDQYSLKEKLSGKSFGDNSEDVIGNFQIIEYEGRKKLCKSEWNEKLGKDMLTVASDPFYVVGRTHHIENDMMGVRLASSIERQTGKYNTFTLGELDAAQKLKRKLNDKGYKIENPSLASEYINLVEETLDDTIYISSKIGWTSIEEEQGFVVPKGDGIGIAHLEYDGSDKNLLYAIRQEGSLKDWLSIFDLLDLEKAHPRIFFLLASALLPLFANYHPQFEGFTVNIAPDDSEGSSSSNGKTTVQQLMLSLQGSIPKWHTNWDKTLLGIEEYLHTNVGCYLDDISKTKLSSKEREELIYSISDGQSRGTANRQARERSTVLFSTGEGKILGHQGKDGVYVRYADVHLKRSDYGASTSEKTRNIVDHIKATVRQNFGFVYPEAIDIMLRDREELIERANTYTEELATSGQFENAGRIAKRYAMIAIAGEIFIESMRGLSQDPERYSNINSYEIAREMFLVHDKKLANLEEDAQSLAQKALIELFDHFDIDGDIVLTETGEYAGKVDGDTVAIKASQVKKFLPEGMTKPKFLKWMDENGLLIERSKNIAGDGGKIERHDIFRVPKS